MKWFETAAVYVRNRELCPLKKKTIRSAVVARRRRAAAKKYIRTRRRTIVWKNQRRDRSYLRLGRGFRRKRQITLIFCCFKQIIILTELDPRRKQSGFFFTIKKKKILHFPNKTDYKWLAGHFNT